MLLPYARGLLPNLVGVGRSVPVAARRLSEFAGVGVVKSLGDLSHGPVGLVRVQNPRVFKRKSPLGWSKAPVLWADVHLHGKGLRLGLLREYALHQGGIAIDAARPQ
jgi:hypothetical protein